MRLALAQLDPTAGDVAANERAARDAVAAAADRDADLVALPELWDVGYFAFDDYPAAAQGLDGSRLDALADVAAEHGVAVLAGSVVEDLAASAAAGFDTPADEGYANTSVLLDASGERRLVYRKRHLFGYDSREADLLVAGERLDTADVGGFTVAATTCYDLRFPELYRDLLDAGVTLVLVPSAWPYPRVEHWRTLARARAVENQWYLGAVNGVGAQGDARLLGRSTVYDPWGTPMASAGDEATLVVADVEPERVREVRDSFPALDDRRR
ncbi:putative amidohydrolase [Halarchaeum rubridurum]|uniref:Hydrolase n=1 Tax=Halarchaeum rubridurum TaxID=489911 RepID=A0A830G3Q4_9EURY|nr:nitrilase-related carbon-nitrogen hydrolase [Halarchaeum rubridurum]MBP1955544.1 putative amidohydrolase [Halarchaeum rubridurum]GGM73220.1 hydrolase [Halarchaeum rubridurum]